MGARLSGRGAGAAGTSGQHPPMGGATAGYGPSGGEYGGGLFGSFLPGGDLFSDSEFELNRESRGGVVSIWSRGSRPYFRGMEGDLGDVLGNDRSFRRRSSHPAASGGLPCPRPARRAILRYLALIVAWQLALRITSPRCGFCAASDAESPTLQATAGGSEYRRSEPAAPSWLGSRRRRRAPFPRSRRIRARRRRRGRRWRQAAAPGRRSCWP